MKYTEQEYLQALRKNVLNVYGIFQECFGEEYVDLQNMPESDVLLDGMTPDSEGMYELDDGQLETRLDALGNVQILVYWPKVTVTNEHNRSIVITDLYAKVPLSMDGTMPYESWGFYLNRGSYNTSQFRENYMHSHVSQIPRRNFTQFQQPCLGRGPILETVRTLKTECDEVMWCLFCNELDSYVRVESIRGVPYHKLENIMAGNGGEVDIRAYQYIGEGRHNTFVKSPLYAQFIKYYIQNGHLSFDYINGSFVPGLDIFDYIVDVSNSFISFLNELHRDKIEEFRGESVIGIYRWRGRHIYKVDNSTVYDYSEYIGKPVCIFKGNQINMSITDCPSSDDNSKVTLLHTSVASKIMFDILRILNYRYERDNIGRRSPGVSEKTIYI